MKINFREEIKDIKAYEPGKPIEDVQREYGIEKVIKLASNENPLGYSKKAKCAIENALDSIAIYPDGNSLNLRGAIGKKFNINIENIIPSSGLDEMIDIIAKTFIDEGDEVIMADITFPRYITVTKIMGGNPIVVPLKDFKYDLQGMKNKINPKTKLIWLCNPNNPTGTIFKKNELEEFLRDVPANVIVVYDEAYGEYAEDDNYPRNILDLLENYPNMLVLRTFSKIYGLASLRVGYAIADKNIVQNLNKVRGAFNVNKLAQVAAISSLNDDEFLRDAYNENLKGKKFLYNAFNEMNIEYVKSDANHIFLDTNMDSRYVFEEMQKRGVIIRPMGASFIRVTIGLEEENKEFIKVLKEVLNK